ncbi:MAG: DUF1775 domain-containing protein [Acidimicrobiia bacterium]
MLTAGGRSRRSIVVSVLALGALLLACAPAAAHVEPDPNRVEPGDAVTVAFLVTHGCDESPTVKLTFKIPKGGTDVAPEDKDGWEAAKKGKTVVFEGGPLDTDTEDSFAIGFTAPNKKTLLVWKVVQKCEDGVIRWIDTSEGAEESPPVVGVGKDAPEEHGEEAEETGH